MDDEKDVMFCRICLRTDLTQKYILTDIVQRKFIETIFKENGYFKDLEERSYACFECRTLLHRSYNFIQKALRAQKALYELQEKHKLLTYSLLQSLDRDNYKINSNLICCIPNIYVLQSLDIKLEDTVTVKAEPSESEDDRINIEVNINNNVDPSTKEINNIDSSVVKNETNVHHLNLSPTSDSYIDPKKFTIMDPQFTQNCLTDSYVDPYNEDMIKIKPEIVFDEINADVEELNYVECQDPLVNKPVTNKRKRKNSDDSFTLKKVYRKNKKKVTKKRVQKRIVTLNLLSSDDESCKKKIRKKLEWPAMPILEERFRARKNVNYSGLDGVGERGNCDDFVPSGQDDSDESADNSCDSYDDGGKVIKRKKDTREFPMQCEECESVVTSKHDHRRHYMETHRDKDYPYKRNCEYLLCPECGDSVSQTQWKVHEDKHAGKKIECDICHKGYSCRNKMLEHKRRVHDVGRPHACDYCEKSFFLKCELKLHIRTHTGEKPFKCHICDHRVAHKGNLYVHIRQVHQNMGPVKTYTRKRQRKARKNEQDDEDSDEKRVIKKKGKKNTREKLEQSNGKKKKVRKSKDRKEIEESSGKKEDSKRNKKDSGDKKRKRREVTSDSASEFNPADLLEACELKDN